MRRALTIIELLLALSLLSTLLIATASWLQVSARSTTELAAPAQWNAIAQRVLELIHDDLAVGDFLPKNSQADAEKPKVSLIDRHLRIATRDGGAAYHEYVLDHSTKRLVLRIVPEGAGTTNRTLLGGVEQCEYELDQKSRTLTVKIASTTGTIVERSYVWR